MGIALHDFDIRTDSGDTVPVVVAASAVGTPGREREPLLGAEKALWRDSDPTRHDEGRLTPNSPRGNLWRDRSGSRRRVSSRRPARLGRSPAGLPASGQPLPRGRCQRASIGLEGERSPWEERAVFRWKRRGIATDSSVEKSPGIDMSAAAALTGPPGNGWDGRRHRYGAVA